MQVYCGESTSYRIEEKLCEHTEYQVRVCAQRVSQTSDACAMPPSTPKPTTALQVADAPSSTTSQQQPVGGEGEVVEGNATPLPQNVTDTYKNTASQEATSTMPEATSTGSSDGLVTSSAVGVQGSEPLSGAFSPGVRFQTKRVQQVQAVTRSEPSALRSTAANLLPAFEVTSSKQREILLVMWALFACLLLVALAVYMFMPHSYYDPGPVENGESATSPPPSTDHEDQLELHNGEL